jgi:hypothetical protein
VQVARKACRRIAVQPDAANPLHYAAQQKIPQIGKCCTATFSLDADQLNRPGKTDNRRNVFGTRPHLASNKKKSRQHLVPPAGKGRLFS